MPAAPHDGQTEAPEGQNKRNFTRCRCKKEGHRDCRTHVQDSALLYFAFQCMGDQEHVAVPGERRVALFSLVRLSCRARGHDYALKCASNLGKAALHRWINVHMQIDTAAIRVAFFLLLGGFGLGIIGVAGTVEHTHRFLYVCIPLCVRLPLDPTMFRCLS